MKRKTLYVTLIIVFAVMLSAFALFFILYIKNNFFTSQEMKSLRNFEKELGLPIPQNRSEEDKGKYKDLWGAEHFSRRISYAYENTSYLEDIKNKLKQYGWSEKKDDSIFTTYQYKKNNADSCILLTIFSDNEYYKNNNSPATMTLDISSKDEDICK